jgi:hypothetical protein
MDRRWITLETIATRTRLRREALIMDRLALANTPTLPSPDVISKVLLGGDLAQLTPQQQISYYRAVCDSLGLNPLTKPFEFLRLSGRLVLYALRNATDQLRHRYNISVQIVARELLEDCYVVTARATFPDGRHDESIGAVPIAGLKGESRSNAMMKCETKAKRRVTLSLVGLSTLDESEVESIPGAQPVPVDLGRECSPPPLNKSLTPSPGPVAPHAAIADPGTGAPAAPADMNAPIPEAWKPFVRTEAVTGIIVGGKRSRTTGKTTVTLAGGAECWTLDHDVAKAAIAYKEQQTPITITITEANEIVTLAEATDAAF